MRIIENERNQFENNQNPDYQKNQCENNENHENILKKKCENNENHKNIRNPFENQKF